MPADPPETPAPPCATPGPTPGSPPVTLRAAGALTVVEGAVGLVVAALLALRELRGVADEVVSGYGIGLWFATIGGGVLVAGVALWRGRRGGRAPAVVVQLVLTPVAWTLVTDSGWVWLGIVLAAFVLAIGILLFVSPSQAWMRDRFREEHPPIVEPARPLSAREERSRRGRPERPR